MAPTLKGEVTPSSNRATRPVARRAQSRWSLFRSVGPSFLIRQAASHSPLNL